MRINNQYLVKWKGCHPKEFKCVKPIHLDHLPKWLKSLNECRAMRWEIRKCIKINNVDEDINLQKARGVRTKIRKMDIYLN